MPRLIFYYLLYPSLCFSGLFHRLPDFIFTGPQHSAAAVCSPEASFHSLRQRQLILHAAILWIIAEGNQPIFGEHAALQVGNIVQMGTDLHRAGLPASLRMPPMTLISSYMGNALHAWHSLLELEGVSGQVVQCSSSSLIHQSICRAVSS